MVAETGGGLLGTLIAIATLFYVREPWVLIAGTVLSNALSSVLHLRARAAEPAIRVEQRGAQEIWRFRACSRTRSSSTRFMNLDDLLVARLMGTAALGVYSMSYNMVNSSVLFLTRPLSGSCSRPWRLLDDRAASARAPR